MGVYSGENAAEARELIAEMNAILEAMKDIDATIAREQFLALEARHHAITVRLRELDQSQR